MLFTRGHLSLARLTFAALAAVISSCAHASEDDTSAVQSLMLRKTFETSVVRPGAGHREFCAVAASALKSGVYQYIKADVRTDDPKSPNLEVLNRCLNADVPNDPAGAFFGSARSFGDRDFRLYYIDVPESKESILVVYAEMSEERLALNDAGGFNLVDCENCELKGSFSSQQATRVNSGDVLYVTSVTAGMFLFNGTLVGIDLTSLEKYRDDPQAVYNIAVSRFDATRSEFVSDCVLSVDKD